MTFAPAGSTRVAAVLVSVAGAFGVSWKAVGPTLGKALTQAESSLWEAEVAVDIGQAATVLPRRHRAGDVVTASEDADAR